MTRIIRSSAWVVLCLVPAASSAAQEKNLRTFVDALEQPVLSDPHASMNAPLPLDFAAGPAKETAVVTAVTKVAIARMRSVFCVSVEVMSCSISKVASGCLL